MDFKKLISLAFVFAMAVAAQAAPVQAQTGYDDGGDSGQAVRQTFLAQAQAVRDQDLDLWGAITLPTITLDGKAMEQFDMFLAMLDQAQNDPEGFAQAHDPERIQDVVVLGDSAMLYYDDPTGRVVQFTYRLDSGAGYWRLAEIW